MPVFPGSFSVFARLFDGRKKRAGEPALYKVSHEGLIRRRLDIEESAGACQVFGASAVGEEAIVPDAVEALWQDVEQEAADELGSLEGHGLLAVGGLCPVVLPFEGDGLAVEGDEAALFVAVLVDRT